MVRLNLICGVVSCLLVLAGAAGLSAAPPWQSMLKKVEADPAKPYTLTEQNGPWLILCTSFAGEGAEKEAHDLAVELRSKFKMPAYVYREHYDFTKEEKGLGLNRYGEPKKMKPLMSAKFDEVAVLVGDFPAIDDPKMKKTLEQIWYAQPSSMQVQEGKAIPRYLALREFNKMISSNQAEKAKGPMNKAFVTRNPLLPADFFSAKGLDPLVKEMNQEVEYGLLKCPGKFTVQIAHFTGAVTIDQRKVRELEQGTAGPTDRLEAAAIKAHTLTQALRKSGVEAYEFHDREASIVTVGSFEQEGTPRPDGRTEINPAIYKIMQDYGPQKVGLPGQASVGLQPRVIAGIACDVQPLPVKVPKDSLGSNYARAGAFR